MGLFISFEGPDGSGKSTQAHLLAEALRARGLPVTETREPGGTPVGERVRDVLLDPDSPSPSPLVMALLLSASRAQLVEDVIRPALARGDIVVVDRYADSTTAYQGFGLGVDRSILNEMRKIATGGLDPNVTVYVDVEPRVGAARMKRRGAHNRLDRESEAFHARVREGYRQLIAEAGKRWVCVDGDAPPEAVHQQIMTRLLPLIEPAVPA
ncbi:MAG TPA: dTMP kinase [Chloroflexota bacterium]|nr:dTMP kinase [Chloroflexota bacterium]